MRPIALIVGIVVLIAALVFLNNGIGRNAPPDHDDEDAQTSAQTNSKAQESAPSSATPPTQTPPAEEALGTPHARFQLTVGWVYDDDAQIHPDQLTQTLDFVRRFVNSHNGMISAEIVDLDVPEDQRSPAARAVTQLGACINGKPLAGMTDNPGEGQTTTDNLTKALMALR